MRKSHREYLVDVAPQVREIMRRTGLGQNKTAELLKVSWGTVSLWLNGHRALPVYADKVRAALKRLDRQATRTV